MPGTDTGRFLQEMKLVKKKKNRKCPYTRNLYNNLSKEKNRQKT